MSVAELKQEEFEAKTKGADGLVVVDFYADWCGPCKMLSPLIAELSEENQEIAFYKVNVDENQDLAMEYGVMSIPTVLFLKNGETVAVEVGVKPKSYYEQILDANR